MNSSNNSNLRERAKKAFNENKEYFEMLEKWHQSHEGIAVEKKVLDLIENNIKVGNKVLDAGCGEGSQLIWLAKKHPDINFFGADISKIGIEMAQKKSQQLNNIIWQKADLEGIPFPENFFDLIYSQSTFEHIFNFKKALQELKRILKPGGKLIIRVPNGNRTIGKPRMFFNYLFKKNKPIPRNPSFVIGQNKLKDHMTNFDFWYIPSDTLLNELKKIGFKINFFSTSKEWVFESEKYQGFSWLKKILVLIYLKLNFFPFNHLGPVTVILAQK